MTTTQASQALHISCSRSIPVIFLLLLLVQSTWTTTPSCKVSAFLTPPSSSWRRGGGGGSRKTSLWSSRTPGDGGRSNNIGDGGRNGGNNNNNNNGPIDTSWGWPDQPSRPFANSLETWSVRSNATTQDEEDEDENASHDMSPTMEELRGGSNSSSSSNNKNKTAKQNEIVKGGKAALTRTAGFWKSTFDRASSRMTSTLGRLWPFGNHKSKSPKTTLTSTQQELLRALETLPIRRVAVPNTTVLPTDVVRIAVKRSGIIGNPLRTDRVQELAQQLKRWYNRQGYVLHTVTGATLQPDTATAEIQVDEPVVSMTKPVELVFCSEMVIDDDTGQLMTFKQFYQKHQAKSRAAAQQKNDAGGRRLLRLADRPPERSELNTTLVVTGRGRTNPHRIAEALQLRPGEPFRWHDDRWRKIATSGIFKVLKTSPTREGPPQDVEGGDNNNNNNVGGGVSLQVVCIEPPARHLEYGVGKSVWTNAWEGEVDFDWRNVFGGGESVGVLVRRGTRDASPSIRLRYGDDKFGLEGGYDMEVFSDYIGDVSNGEGGSVKKMKKPEEEEEEKTNNESSTLDANSVSTLEDYDEDSLLNRRGATFRLRNPISPRLIANSVASASLERTSTTTGLQESIGSATLTLGPFRRLLPMDARSSLSTTVTGGTRLRGADSTGNDGDLRGGGSDDRPGFLSSLRLGAAEVLPYSSATATTRQILPIALPPSQDGRPSTTQPITLALEHTLATSTSNLPRHEAKAMGYACHIRGASPDGPTSSTLKGTTEIRIPLVAPQIGTGMIVFFGDWFYVQKDASSPFYSKSSIGVGIRKNFQGLPLKFDLCYSSEGKIKPHYSLGLDFDA